MAIYNSANTHRARGQRVRNSRPGGIAKEVDVLGELFADLGGGLLEQGIVRVQGVGVLVQLLMMMKTTSTEI
jgi:hypothetical protein